jgi:hypothetical protein
MQTEHVVVSTAFALRSAYPALRPFTPVLSRGGRALQIGLDQEPTLVLVDVEPGMAQLLSMVDGCHHRSELQTAAVALGVSARQLDWVLRTLDDAQLLDDGGGRRTGGLSVTPTQRVRLVGAGSLGHEVGQLLCRSSLSVLHVIDPEPPDPVLYPSSGALGSQAEAFAASWGGSSATRVQVANHWSKPDGIDTDLTIVASDRLECDRVLTEGLLRADQPHLVLRPRAGGVVVGPLVLPGRTACLRCTDLARRDADAAWPTLLPQLLRTRTPITAALAGWAGGVAAAQALAFLQGSTPETCGATLEISPADHVTRRRSWSMHPGCGCGWGATAQWGA